MNRLLQLFQFAGLNSIMLIGVIGAGWSDGTAIALFWCENMMMVPLISLRIILHRRATNKRGHYVEEKVKYNSGPWQTRTTTFNKSFLQIVGFFTIVEGAFIAFAVFVINRGNVDFEALKQGVPAAAAFLLAGFGIDMIGLGQRPFAWLNKLSEVSLRRAVLLLFAIMIGFPLAAWLDRPKLIFGIFGGLKLFFDVAGMFPQFNPPEAPRWMVRILGRDFADYWRRERTQEKHTEQYNAVAAEEPYDGRPVGGV